MVGESKDGDKMAGEMSDFHCRPSGHSDIRTFDREGI